MSAIPAFDHGKMELPDFDAMNSTLETAVADYPVCQAWREGAEDSVFQLANIFLVLGFMGGSGLYGLLYMLTLLTLGFFCATVWSWEDACTTDGFLWNFALFGVCVGQLVHVSYRLRIVTFDKEFQELYNCMFNIKSSCSSSLERVSYKQMLLRRRRFSPFTFSRQFGITSYFLTYVSVFRGAYMVFRCCNFSVHFPNCCFTMDDCSRLRAT